MMRKVAVVVVAVFIGILSSINAETGPADAQQLTNWKTSGGDPCGESWKGITCSGSRVTEINISGLGLSGNMGYQLDKLTSVTTFDISNNNLGNQIPYQLPPNVQRLNLAGNGFTAGLPYSISQMTSLKYLNVSHNQIEGQVAIPFSSLTALSTLYLQNNKFTGNIDVLGNLPLENLNIKNNQFSGQIPEQLKSIHLQLSGNLFKDVPAPPTSPGTPPARRPPNQNQKSEATSSSLHSGGSEGNGGGGSKSGIGAGAIAGIVISVLIVGAIIALFIVKRRSRKPSVDIEKHDNVPFAPPASQQSQGMNSVQSSSTTSTTETPVVIDRKPPPVDDDLKSFDDDTFTPPVPPPKKVNKGPINAKLYSVADLQTATNSFSVDNLIGEGTLGRVYRAQLDDGQVLAVKKIKSPSQSNSKDFVDIVSEVSRLRHPNVTELVGYCSEHEQHLLVYELHQNGTLHEFLHLLDDQSKALTWNNRVKIALGAARAIDKQFSCSNQVVLCRLWVRKTDHESSDEASGYNAPEVSMSGQYTVKSDVYSFGVVMLELLSGRTPFDSSRPRTEQSLVRWATPQLHDIDALAKMVDPALDGLYPVKSLSRFADVIALCVQPEPEFRPPMSEVVESLVRVVEQANMS
ncbi:UNVERIFIED_CONTAM: protein STRUBBELIG-RECEPTOR FAMILY 7 [Sesamum latifolium]|uniref:Protein STRUBBELIG-RECEPTOR FAMILY 7 n=1 Tax=Sesamum latifolium TaxID=2727402 RepID=A0AAW2YDC5_9LAMI